MSLSLSEGGCKPATIHPDDPPPHLSLHVLPAGETRISRGTVQDVKSHCTSALGLTDHNLLTGSIEFVTACSDAGIQPILGLEIDFEGSPLQLLATGFEGWSNLCRLSSAIALESAFLT